MNINVQMPTQEEIHIAFKQGIDTVVALFAQVEVQVGELAGELEKQAVALKELQARLGKNSRNSNKPPSSDEYGKPPVKRTESLRRSDGKRNGGQPGHEGNTLKPSETPEHTEIHEAETCKECGTPLKEAKVMGHEERQVFDIPAIRIEVTAHRAEIKVCPLCGSKNRGEFPFGVTAPVQYGSGIKTWAAYFTHQHFVPLERTSQIFEDLIHHHVSEAVVLKAGEELSKCVHTSVEAVKKQLSGVRVVNTDESGMRVRGKLHWLHTASDERRTHYEIHAKRGKEAMDAIGILPDFKGTLVHDHWKPYFGYEQCNHALCNAHHLRELQYIEKQYDQVWAADMAELLREIKKATDEVRQEADNHNLSPEQIKDFEQRYDIIVNKGYEANPHPPPEKNKETLKKKGRYKQTPPLNLLDRLRDFKLEVLRFMYDLSVPFDNNQAERDIRMVKVKQKISGSFRTTEGASCFANIRGYISTARKNTVNVFSIIRDAFAGKPFIPTEEI